MGRKKLNRRQVLNGMSSENFQIGRLESTPVELAHAEKRFKTLKLGQLEGRIVRMTNPWKLIATIRVARSRGMVGMARRARVKLNTVLDAS